jgi:hypothetical protein
LKAKASPDVTRLMGGWRSMHDCSFVENSYIVLLELIILQAAPPSVCRVSIVLPRWEIEVLQSSGIQNNCERNKPILDFRGHTK